LLHPEITVKSVQKKQSFLMDLIAANIHASFMQLSKVATFLSPTAR